VFSRPIIKRRIAQLGAREILALAINSENEDRRRYLEYAEALRETAPQSAATMERLAEIEKSHYRRLLKRFHETYGENVPLVRREDVAGFASISPLWLLKPRGPSAIRGQAMDLEVQARNFYEKASAAVTDPTTKALLRELAEEEEQHEMTFAAMGVEAQLEHSAEDELHQRRILLRYVQPGLAGLMDGSVSTLAPLFAAAFATQDSWAAFLVGMAASIGAGISMGFAEALSDDGALTGRGPPVVRGRSPAQ